MPWHPIEIRHTQTEQAEQRAYDRIYVERGLHQRDSLYLWFLDQVRRFAPPPARLLDISCGEGDFLRFARRAGYSVTGSIFRWPRSDASTSAAARASPWLWRMPDPAVCRGKF